MVVKLLQIKKDDGLFQVVVMGTEKNGRLTETFQRQVSWYLMTLGITVFSGIYCGNLAIHLLTITTAIVAITQCLPRIKQCSKCFTQINSFHSHNPINYHAYFTKAYISKIGQRINIKELVDQIPDLDLRNSKAKALNGYTRQL